MVGDAKGTASVRVKVHILCKRTHLFLLQVEEVANNQINQVCSQIKHAEEIKNPETNFHRSQVPFAETTPLGTGAANASKGSQTSIPLDLTSRPSDEAQNEAQKR